MKTLLVLAFANHKLRSVINKKNVNNNTTLSLTVDNTSIEKHTSISDTFNRYFTSVGKNLASNFH